MAGVSSPSSTTAEVSEGQLVCEVALSQQTLDGHFSMRREVFVDEQRLFPLDDRDERDDDARTLHVIGLVDGRIRGAVRLYPLDEAGSLWKGDRLAVAREHRANHLGARLVRFAVASAGDAGGHTMIAHIQLPNVRFFEHLGWRCAGEPGPFHGVQHQLMSIRLGPRRGR
jgi:putative N-acetyltransferase (TIGR04045 family)